jgi:hypothetical protein
VCSYGAGSTTIRELSNDEKSAERPRKFDETPRAFNLCPGDIEVKRDDGWSDQTLQNIVHHLFKCNDFASDARLDNAQIFAYVDASDLAKLLLE